MIKKSYDAIVIGGGHNGLCLAAYLQRAGMDVAVFERRHEEGGPVWTDELAAPGFWCNHAQNMEFFESMPFLHDFELEKLGLRSVYPEAQLGITFADGRPPIVCYNVSKPENYERTRKSIAVYSKQDADNFVDIRRKARDLEPFLLQFFYSPPPMPTKENPDPLSAFGRMLMTMLGLPEELADRTPKDLIDHLFESPEMRTMMYRASPDWASPLEEEGLAAFSVISMFLMTLVGRLCVGGTHTLAHAMAMAAVREGADIYERSPVDKVLIEDGKAVGVRLADGTEVTARKLVASNADTQQTLLGMVGEENLSNLWVERTREFKYGPSCVVGLFHYALHEAPDFKSARHNPDINRCYVTYVGYESPEDILSQIRESEAGKIPKNLGSYTAVSSVFDPSYAPPGKHIWYTGPFFPKASSLSPEEWEEVRADYPQRIYEVYARSCTNLTRENFIGVGTDLPIDFQNEKGLREGDFCNGAIRRDQLAHNRPFPEAAMYRAEVGGLYLCGPGQHPLGGVNAAPGYNAYKVVAEDFDLDYRPWLNHERGY